MNRTMKGALAVAAAVALTLGGAGSLAYWQASQTTSAAQFTTGTLELASNSDGAWTRDGVTIDPETAVLVPGQVLVYAETFDATVAGDDIAVKAEAVVGALTPSETVANGPQVSAATLTGPVNRLNSTVWEIEGTGVVTLTFTLTIPAGMTEGRDLDIDLAATTVTLTQVATLPADENPCAC